MLVLLKNIKMRKNNILQKYKKDLSGDWEGGHKQNPFELLALILNLIKIN